MESVLAPSHAANKGGVWRQATFAPSSLDTMATFPAYTFCGPMDAGHYAPACRRLDVAEMAARMQYLSHPQAILVRLSVRESQPVPAAVSICPRSFIDQVLSRMPKDVVQRHVLALDLKRISLELRGVHSLVLSCSQLMVRLTRTTASSSSSCDWDQGSRAVEGWEGQSTCS